jgi:hypothetical protein
MKYRSALPGKAFLHMLPQVRIWEIDVYQNHKAFIGPAHISSTVRGAHQELLIKSLSGPILNS